MTVASCTKGVDKWGSGGGSRQGEPIRRRNQLTSERIRRSHLCNREGRDQGGVTKDRRPKQDTQAAGRGTQTDCNKTHTEANHAQTGNYQALALASGA